MTDQVTCLLCGEAYNNLAARHLRSIHGIDKDEYLRRFPGAEILSPSTKAKLVAGGRQGGRYKRSDETKAKISASRTGIRPKNHPRFVKGAYKASDETRRKMSEAWKKRTAGPNKGRIFSDEWKANISKAQTGKPRPDLRGKTTWMKGKKHSPETIEHLREIAIERESGVSFEEKQRRGYANRGKKRSEESKERYRKAAIKRLNDGLFAPSKTEIFFSKLLEERGIRFKHQFFIAGYSHSFDFLIDGWLIIELDGAHHWHDAWWAEGETKEQALERHLVEDAGHNLVAGRAGYKIARVRYRSEASEEEIRRQLREQVGWEP